LAKGERGSASDRQILKAVRRVWVRHRRSECIRVFSPRSPYPGEVATKEGRGLFCVRRQRQDALERNSRCLSGTRVCRRWVPWIFIVELNAQSFDYQAQE